VHHGGVSHAGPGFFEPERDVYLPVASPVKAAFHFRVLQAAAERDAAMAALSPKGKGAR
jgi:hypothetical protein